MGRSLKSLAISRAGAAAIVVLLIISGLLMAVVYKNYETNPSGSAEWSSLKGVNYFWTTVLDPSRPQAVAPPPQISFPEIEANGWNLIRVQLHWNQYVVNASQYVQNMQTIAWYAERYNISIIWDLIHQAGTSSQYYTDGLEGVGIPTFLTAPYPTPSSFWFAWWANKTSYKGEAGWALALQYEESLVMSVNNYTSTLGYEIMNEPPLFSSNGSDMLSTFNLEGMHAFNTYIADGLRAYTSKMIIYDRPYLHPDILGYCVFSDPSCLSVVAPQSIKDVAMDFHLYNAINYTLLAGIESFSVRNGIPIFLGEFAPCSRTNTTCPASDSYAGQYIRSAISVFHEYGWAWTYWSWRTGTPGPPWQSLLNSTGGQWWLDREIVEAQSEVYQGTS